jgi:thiol-disulfide isomerase/thioredoxin
MRRSGAASLFLVTWLLSGCAGARASPATSPLVGQPVDVEAQDLDGRLVRVADDLGRVRVIDFWATWCEPCRDQLALLDRLARDGGAQAPLVYAVSMDEDRAQVASYLAGWQLALTILWDKGGARHGERLDVQQLPLTLVVDRAGTLRFLHQGYRPDDAEQLRRELRLLLAEPAPEAPR